MLEPVLRVKRKELIANLFRNMNEAAKSVVSFVDRSGRFHFDGAIEAAGKDIKRVRRSLHNIQHSITVYYVLAKGLQSLSKVSYCIRRVGAGFFVVHRDSGRVGTRGTRVAAAVRRGRRKRRRSARRCSRCSINTTLAFDARTISSVKKRPMRHKCRLILQVSQNLFLSCIYYLLPCGGDGRWCENNNSDLSVLREVVGVINERLAEWQLT
jgi:hypothetical protein